MDNSCLQYLQFTYCLYVYIALRICYILINVGAMVHLVSGCMFIGLTYTDTLACFLHISAQICLESSKAKQEIKTICQW